MVSGITAALSGYAAGLLTGTLFGVLFPLQTTLVISLIILVAYVVLIARGFIEEFEDVKHGIISVAGTLLVLVPLGLWGDVFFVTAGYAVYRFVSARHQE